MLHEQIIKLPILSLESINNRLLFLDQIGLHNDCLFKFPCLFDYMHVRFLLLNVTGLHVFKFFSFLGEALLKLVELVLEGGPLRFNLSLFIFKSGRPVFKPL